MVEHAHGMTGELAALLAYRYAAPYLGILDFLSDLGKVGSYVLQFMANPVGTIIGWFLPGLTMTGEVLKDVIQTQGTIADHPTARAIFDATQKAGLAMVGVAIAGRALKMALSRDSVTPGTILLDTTVRAVVTVGMILSAYDVLLWIFQASCTLGGDLLGAFITIDPASDTFLAKVSNATNIFGFLPVLAGLLMFLYLIFIMLGAKILFWFVVSITPLVIPVWAFGGGKQILEWWLKTMTGVLLCPIVAGTGAGVTIAFGVAFQESIPLLGGLAATLVMAAGFFFTANMLRNLCLSAFEMGSIVLGVTLAMAKGGQEALQKVAGVAAPAAAGAAGGAEGAAAAGGGGATTPGGGGGGLFLPDPKTVGRNGGDSSDKSRFRDILNTPGGQDALNDDGDDSLINLAGGPGAAARNPDHGSRMRTVMAAAAGTATSPPNQNVVHRLLQIEADNLASSATPRSAEEEARMTEQAAAPRFTDRRY